MVSRKARSVTRVGESSRQPQANSGCAAWICMWKPPVKNHPEVTSARTPPEKSAVGEKSRKQGQQRRVTAKKPGFVGGRGFRHRATNPRKPGNANSACGLSTADFICVSHFLPLQSS